MKASWYIQIAGATLMLPAQSLAQTFELPLPPVTDIERSLEMESLAAAAPAVPPDLAELRFLRSLESLCGPDDMIDVELYQGTLGATEKFVDGHQASTAQIQWNDDLAAQFGPGAGNVNGQRWCTGTLIADDLLLTAGHCFNKQNDPFGWVTPSRIVNDQRVFIEPGEIALNMHVNFNFQVDGQTLLLRDATVFPIEELVEYGIPDGLDYAIVRLGQDDSGALPGPRFGIRSVAAALPQDGELVTILQHPAGRPKKVEAGTATTFGDFDVQYADIDTLGGSSGSGVLNTQGELVAVHTNGGCGPTSGSNRALSVRTIASSSDVIQ
jgi:Trypsin-like peptidase domain